MFCPKQSKMRILNTTSLTRNLRRFGELHNYITELGPRHEVRTPHVLKLRGYVVGVEEALAFDQFAEVWLGVFCYGRGVRVCTMDGDFVGVAVQFYAWFYGYDKAVISHIIFCG